jgi:release factor glutamine methyltransferase
LSLAPFTRDAIVSDLRAAGCVFAEEEAALIIETAPGEAQRREMVRRRSDGAPLEQVLGWAEFAGLRILVDPGVFVPRRRTEFMALTAARGVRTGTIVVDLCCGTGAIGAVLADRGATVFAADIHPASVACARRNLEPRGGRVYGGDLFDALPATLRGTVDVLVANVPYVPTGAISLMPAEARDHEPLVALDGGEDGLALLRRVAAGAPDWLAPGGRVLMETSEEQASAAIGVIAAAGLVPELATDDELEATVVIGRRAAPAPAPGRG